MCKLIAIRQFFTLLSLNEIKSRVGPQNESGMPLRRLPTFAVNPVRSEPVPSSKKPKRKKKSVDKTC